MAARRSKTEREQGLEKLSRLYLTGRTQREMGQVLGISQSAVSKDLVSLQTRWRESGLVNIDSLKWRELARIDFLERTYWRSFRKSCQDEEIKAAEKTTDKDGEKTKTSTRRRGQTGDPAFLAGVQWCIEQRCKILGLVLKKFEAPPAAEPAPPAVQIGGINVGMLSNEQLEQLDRLLALAEQGEDSPGTAGTPESPLPAEPG